MTESAEHVTTCQLRWADFDVLGHLNQAVYHSLMEVARVRWLEAVTPEAFTSANRGFVLARVELDYRREVAASEREVVATCRPLKVGTSSIVCEQQVRRADGTVAATGQVVMVAWDGAARGKRELSDEEREAFGA